MKKILFIFVATMMISSCTTERPETTFVVKFQDGTEMKVVGINASALKNSFCVYHKGGQASVFAKEEVLYILKEQ